MNSVYQKTSLTNMYHPKHTNNTELKKTYQFLTITNCTNEILISDVNSVKKFSHDYLCVFKNALP